MGKGFSKLSRIILAAGFVITIGMGVKAYLSTEINPEYELLRNEAEKGGYEQELIAHIGKERIPLTVTVDERTLTREEAKAEFLRAKELLPKVLKGENESLENVTTDLNFAGQIPDTLVRIQWTETALDYFYSDGKMRTDFELLEAVELKLSAILSCQEYSEDYEVVIRVMPRVQGVSEKLLKQIEKENEENPKNEALVLPKEYEGENVIWKKAPDTTFIYFGCLTVFAVLFMKFGQKRDESEAKKERLEALERDYAQLVSKFTMLISAGLSVRNAWERIVLLYRRKGESDNILFQELNWGILQMQKGVSELEVYEAFGIRTGQIHYKKLMALFISDRRRGSINLLEAMNREMLSAWEEQKRKTRQRGEKIGTKLLIPMMGMLGIVFLIVLVPAFLSFGL